MNRLASQIVVEKQLAASSQLIIVSNFFALFIDYEISSGG